MGKATTLMTLAVVVVLLLFIAAPVEAKEGLYLGANMLFNDISGEINASKSVEPGHGLGLHGGYGFNQYLAIETGYWKTKHANRSGRSATDLETGTLDLKITVPASGSYIEPYLLIGAGTYRIEQNGISSVGKSGRIGIGMDVYLSPEISFNVGLTQSNVTFTNNAVDIEGRITTMDYGITYHFM